MPSIESSKKNMTKIIKVILIALLLGCLANVPYGYFQFVRIASCIAFFWLAYKSFEEDKKIMGLILLGCAILFNPIFKIHFTRGVWNKIDVVIAIFLFICLVLDLFNKVKNKSDEAA